MQAPRLLRGAYTTGQVIRQCTQSTPLPPEAAFLGSLSFVQLPLKPRHQVFSVLQPRPCFAQVDLRVGDAFLHGLMFPAAVIRLLLNGATVGYFSVQSRLVCRRLAPQLSRLGLGSGKLVAWCVVRRSLGCQLARQAFYHGLQGRDGSGYGVAKHSGICSRTRRRPSFTWLLRTGAKHFGRDTDFHFQVSFLVRRDHFALPAHAAALALRSPSRSATC